MKPQNIIRGNQMDFHIKISVKILKIINTGIFFPGIAHKLVKIELFTRYFFTQLIGGVQAAMGVYILMKPGEQHFKITNLNLLEKVRNILCCLPEKLRGIKTPNRVSREISKTAM